MKLRVGACQILTFPNPEKSAEKVIHWMEIASKDGVDVIAFPEACLCGYSCDSEYWKKINPDDFKTTEARIIEIAKQLKIAVVLGSVHWENGGKPFNSLLIIDKGGEVRGRYAKTHLAESWSRAGKYIPIFSVAGIKSCFIICHDIRYPELVRLPAIAGAQICYFCSNESGLTAEYKLSAYRAMPIGRAAENGIYLIMANAPGDPNNLFSRSQSHGNSKIIDPNGNVICEAGHFEETLMTATIDLQAASRQFAKRSIDDDTILRQWMQDGTRIVEKKI